MFPQPHRLVEILLSSKHRHPPIATRRALGIHAPGVAPSGTVPSCPYLASSLCALLSLQALVFIKCQSPHVIQGRGIGGGVGKSPLFQGRVGAVRAECWCGVRGKAGEGRDGHWGGVWKEE